MTPFEIFRVPLTIYRQVGGSYFQGRWTGQTETSFSITASIQPTTGEELMTLPEGRRNRKTYALFTSTKIELIDNAQNPDQIDIYGERYEVVRVEPWQNNPSIFGIVNHFKFFAQKLEAIK